MSRYSSSLDNVGKVCEQSFAGGHTGPILTTICQLIVDIQDFITHCNTVTESRPSYSVTASFM